MNLKNWLSRLALALLLVAPSVSQASILSFNFQVNNLVDGPGFFGMFSYDTDNTILGPGNYLQTADIFDFQATILDGLGGMSSVVGLQGTDVFTASRFGPVPSIENLIVSQATLPNLSCVNTRCVIFSSGSPSPVGIDLGVVDFNVTPTAPNGIPLPSTLGLFLAGVLVWR